MLLVDDKKKPLILIFIRICLLNSGTFKINYFVLGFALLSGTWQSWNEKKVSTFKGEKWNLYYLVKLYDHKGAVIIIITISVYVYISFIHTREIILFYIIFSTPEFKTRTLPIPPLPPPLLIFHHSLPPSTSLT